jgi:hypothetical protein
MLVHQRVCFFDRKNDDKVMQPIISGVMGVDWETRRQWNDETGATRPGKRLQFANRKVTTHV